MTIRCSGLFRRLRLRSRFQIEYLVQQRARERYQRDIVCLSRPHPGYDRATRPWRGTDYDFAWQGKSTQLPSAQPPKSSTPNRRGRFADHAPGEYQANRPSLPRAARARDLFEAGAGALGSPIHASVRSPRMFKAALSASTRRPMARVMNRRRPANFWCRPAGNVSCVPTAGGSSHVHLGHQLALARTRSAMP